jgi:hypothetical protein
VFLVGHAVGVQIYSCNGVMWSFVAPRANLYNDNGKLITHFGGPTWQTKDGSKVVGAPDASITVDRTAIPWVRLTAASTTPGQLVNTTYIRRIATVGGLAPPATECNATTAGAVVEVPYTADYYFWKRLLLDAPPVPGRAGPTRNRNPQRWARLSSGCRRARSPGWRVRSIRSSRTSAPARSMVSHTRT